MTDDISLLTPAERFRRTPRPLDFVRPRLGLDIARYLKDLLSDEREAEMETLTELRTAGKTEDDPEIGETVQNLRWIISAEKEINKALIELVGPDR
jgi:hypothetical protein